MKLCCTSRSIYSVIKQSLFDCLFRHKMKIFCFWLFRNSFRPLTYNIAKPPSKYLDLFHLYIFCVFIQLQNKNTLLRSVYYPLYLSVTSNTKICINNTCKKHAHKLVIVQILITEYKVLFKCTVWSLLQMH